MFKRRKLASRTFTLSKEYKNMDTQSESKNKKIFEILNPNKVGNFANIGTVCFTKNTSIVKKKFLVKSISNAQEFYLITYNNKNKDKKKDGMEEVPKEKEPK